MPDPPLTVSDGQAAPPARASSLWRLVGRATPLMQALYFVSASLLALLSRRSFEAISGPKVDYWLVRTVSGLLTVVGVVIALSERRNRLTPEIRWLAMGTSGVLTSIDVVYVAKRRIRPIYLLDAVANLALIAGWRLRTAAQ